MEFSKRMKYRDIFHKVLEVVMIILFTPILIPSLIIVVLYFATARGVLLIMESISNICKSKFFNRYKKLVSKSVIRECEKTLKRLGECELTKDRFNRFSLNKRIGRYMDFCKSQDIDYDFDYFNNELAIHMKKYKDVVVQFYEDDYGDKIRRYKLIKKG